ncbi:ABC transporter substrate-binding protein [Clostridiaceae bacterium HSG29]|nr:ABC transporter substrate-binding protein [Clostridiaceae bacterium HSG29]
MKKSRVLRLLGIALIFVMVFSLFAGCSSKPEATTEADTEQVETEKEEVEVETPKSTTPLVAGYSAFSEKFSPFFADTGYDQEAVDLTQVNLITTDRTGAVVYNAIDGEVIPYNGKDYTYKGLADLEVNYDESVDKTVYKWTIRDDVKFSDGKLLTADDIIFSYYTLSDPSYDGSSTLYSIPIIGMKDYRTQTSSEVYDKFDAMFSKIYDAGLDYAVTDADEFTQEQYDAMCEIVNSEWKKDVQAIVDYCAANYGAYYEDYVGYPLEVAMEKEGLKVAAGMALWGFGEVDAETKVLTTAVTSTEFNLANEEYPTVDDYLAEVTASYGDLASYADAGESPQDVSPLSIAKDVFISTEGPKDPSLAGKGVPNIAGIKKLSDTEVEITLNGFDASAVYKLGIQVAPLHYYGNESKYNYDNNEFGFDFGDLSNVKAKTTQPLGAGAYRLIKYENKVIYYEANENYYKGEPKTYYVQFKEGSDADKISGVGIGTIDVTDPSFGNEAVAEIKSYNSNTEVSGDVITTNTVDNLGYGYIGINAENVKVGTDSASEESKNLRKAFATILAVYRELSIDSYYGERASIINYPMSNTSWAAPQKSDEGYKISFSTDVEGNQIYTSDMNAEDKYEAAKLAAVKYLEAAGFTYDADSGKFTQAPDGAKLEYEIIVPADGKGDHPSFTVATLFKETLDNLGFNIILNDPSDSNVLWDKLDANSQELWCAAWGATIDPDMYQIYHSSNSTNSNHYKIFDLELDKLIIDARKSDDQGYRKATYKAALDIIIDWAVEIPIYQRQNCIIFSSERVDLDTVTPDITTFWKWMEDIENVEMINK